MRAIINTDKRPIPSQGGRVMTHACDLTGAGTRTHHVRQKGAGDVTTLRAMSKKKASPRSARDTPQEVTQKCEKYANLAIGKE